MTMRGSHRDAEYIRADVGVKRKRAGLRLARDRKKRRRVSAKACTRGSLEMRSDRASLT